MMNRLFAVACLMVGMPALATPPAPNAPRPAPCKDQRERTSFPQGTLLWGTERLVKERETSSVLSSVTLGSARLGDKALADLRLEGGRLVSPSAPLGLKGAVFQGAASDGQAMEVAVCGAEPTPEDPSQVWYRIELWHQPSASWVNPCIALDQDDAPRALAVPGVWDESGARRTEAGKFTFACENGVIAKCVGWGYAPWGTKEGRSLEALHQACTRMARADYCGDGRSHTREDTRIDMYDALQVLTRTTESSAEWDVKRASFEAAWSAEGATCLAHTRDGRAVETVMAECPERFEVARKDLGEGDLCTVVRKGEKAEAAPLRNHSYGKVQP